VLREGDPLAGAVVVGDEGDADATDRAGERQAGDLGRHGRGVDGQHVVVLVGRDGQNGHDNLDLVAQAVDERRAQRPVDQAAGEDRFGRRATFAAEEAARDAAGGVHALFHVDGQREEVEVVLRLLAGARGGEKHGLFVDVGSGGALCLLGETPGFETDGALAVLAVVNNGFGERDFWTLHMGVLSFV